jgi:rod shape-determining protein MreC
MLLVAALALITIDFRDSSAAPLRDLRQFGGSVFGGAERVVSAVTDPVTGFFDSHSGSAGGSGSRVAALQRQVIRLQAELAQQQLSKSDYRQLRQLLGLAGRGGYRIVAATVIASGQGYAQTVTLDAGSADGVKPDETVINGQGLVGEVTQVSAQTCTVLLATDATARVGVQLASSGQVGYVTGPGRARADAGLLRLQMFDTSAVLRPGNQLVTTASTDDRPYVPGVPVGVISQVQNSRGGLVPTGLVRPYVDFASLGVVGIVVERPRHNPRYSVLPPSPKAKPTPTVTVTVTPTPTPSAAPALSAGG